MFFPRFSFPVLVGTMGRRRQQRQRKRHFKNDIAFFQSLSRLIQFTENVKCRRISLELISWGMHSSLEREREKYRLLFHVVMVQRRKEM